MIDTRLYRLGLGAAALILAGSLSGCMLMHAAGGCMGGHGDEHSGAPTSATCPVCGSQLKIDERTPRATYGGKLHYFASEDHLREFMKDPDRFLTGKPGGSAEHGEHR